MSVDDCNQCGAGQEEDAGERKHLDGKPNDMIYSVDEVPPWYLCIPLGLQHYMTAFSSTLSIPLLLAPHFCMAQDHLGISQLISTIFFVSGLCTLIQTTIGCRLPIMQGGSFSFLVPSIAILSLSKWCCPFTHKDRCNMNETDIPDVASDDHRVMWKSRIAEIQGAILVSALFQVVIGFSGLMGFVLRFIGPLAIVPTIALIGLSLFGAAANQAAGFWWIAILTIAFISLFSQYLRDVLFPIPAFRNGQGCGVKRIALLKLFPVLLGMCLSWLVCYILTVSGALTSDPKGWGYQARTDSRIVVLNNAPWFRFPYPGQWGTPTVSVSSVFAILAGVLASMVESVGDYYACARLSGAPPPPDHAVNRGIGIEGVGCILAGAWGSGNGTTSYTQNIGAIGITKVGSRRVVQVGGLIMIVLGCLGKFGALFVTLPTPVVGGMFMVMFGMVTAVGLSNLQFVDLNSSRNLFILGFSIFFGLSLPNWLSSNRDAIKTGSDVADQILTVLCSTNMFVGGFCGFVLDNTVPGTEEERGIRKWRQALLSASDVASGKAVDYSAYDFPLVQKYLNRWRWTSYVPFCPSFRGCGMCFPCCAKEGSFDSPETDENGYVNEAATMEDEDSMESLNDIMADPEAAEFLAYKNTSALCDDLQFMGGMSDMCDVKFLVGRDRVPVYGVKVILTTRCRAFYNLILAEEKKITELKPTPKKRSNKLLNFLRKRKTGKGFKTTNGHGSLPPAGPLTIEVPDFEPSIFNRIVLFLQSGTVSVDISNVIGVMNAADTYGVDDLRIACFQFARSFINVQSVLPLYMTTLQQTHFKCTKDVLSEIFAFLDRYAEDVFKVQEFANLPKDVALSLLARPIARASAETKWDAALKWSKRHCNGDLVVMRDVLKSFTPNINLLEIPLSKLLEEVTPICSHQAGDAKTLAQDSAEALMESRSRPVSSGLSFRKSSMSSVCSDSASSTDSGYTSCKESCML
ncbi:solute carrier family 23 member 1-like [Liolophura sinensis]|uniref:solute carrier family 23 member 1-like n=1 Tax=Liolophura sinensis TaxID=3198878 RepID=UPI003157F752